MGVDGCPIYSLNIRWSRMDKNIRAWIWFKDLHIECCAFWHRAEVSVENGPLCTCIPYPDGVVIILSTAYRGTQVECGKYHGISFRVERIFFNLNGRPIL